MSDVWRTLKQEERRIVRDRAREETATVRHVMTTQATGRYTVSEPLMFGVAYRDKPSLEILPESQQWDETGFPVVTVGVREWIRDEGDRYVGAYVWVCVF